MVKNCLECGLEFNVPKCRFEKAKYCSLACRYKAQNTDKNPQRKRKTVKCKQCNTEFEKLNNGKKQFCSRKCYWDYRRENPHIKFQSNQGINLVKKKCLNCGLLYEINKYREKNSKYCSINCHDEYRRESLVCPTCHKIFKAPKYEKRKYCSEKCYTKGVNKGKSKFSTDIYVFLNNLYNVENEFYLKYDGGKYFVDVYLKDYNTMVECNGDYWHCNPKIYESDYYHKQIRLMAKEIWEKDAIKKQKINKLGYKLIILWEYDWNNDENFYNNLKNKIEYEICKNKKN